MGTTAYIALPAIAEFTASDETDRVIGRVDAAAVIDTVQMRLSSAPTGGQSITFRVGTDLDGVEDTDYIEATFTLTQIQKEIPTSLAVGANGTILFRVEDNSSANAKSLSGNVRLQTGGLGFGVTSFYTTQDRVAETLGEDALTSAQENEIDAIIAGVSTLFDQIAGIPFFSRELTEYHSGFALRNGIPLHHKPSELQSDRDLATLSEDGTALALGTEWTMDAALSGGRTVWRLTGEADGFEGARFSNGERNIKVIYRTAPAAIPADIALACAQESARYFKNGQQTTAKDGARLGLSSRSPETGTNVSFTPDDLAPGTMRMLQTYRANGIV